MSMTLLAPANAHDVLEDVQPKDGSTVAAVPAAVKLTFNNTPIALGAELVVRDQNGTNQANGPVVIVDNHVTQAVKAGAPAGRYTVVWRVVSSDSHPIEGSFAFTAGKPGAGSGTAQPSPPSQASTLEPVPAWVFIAGAAVLAAAVFLDRTVRPQEPAGPERSRVMNPSPCGTAHTSYIGFLAQLDSALKPGRRDSQ
jgi:methionine-rich copper-binding protein CopC